MKERKLNKKFLLLIVPIVLILLLIIVSSVFCSKEENKKEEKKEEKLVTYTTKDNKVDYLFTSSFKNSEVGEYDLYVKDDKRQLIMGFFTYDLNNYEEKTGKEVLDKQVSYFVNTRKDMKVFKKEITKNYADKTVIIVEYSGKTDDSSECVYLFSVTEFKNLPSYVVYSTSVIIKDDYEDNIKEIKDILKNSKLK